MALMNQNFTKALFRQCKPLQALLPNKLNHSATRTGQSRSWSNLSAPPINPPPTGLPSFLFPKSFPTDFPLENLPYGLFTTSKHQTPRIGVALGDQIIDCYHLASHDKLPPCFLQSSLNAFLETGKSNWSIVRKTIQSFFDPRHPDCLKNQSKLLFESLHQQSDAVMHVPAHVGDYTDFYSFKEHATNIGTMFRGKENALLPNWKHIPIGYHGRSSSIVVSGTTIRRPKGQVIQMNQVYPQWKPSAALDFELEMAFLIGGKLNKLGTRIPIEDTQNHIFGLVLMNDWSARDLQRWEYQPLGPFLSKSFGTTISPWVVTLEALEPFLCKSPVPDVEQLSYLQHRKNDLAAIDIDLQVALTPSDGEKTIISKTNFKHMYWTIFQQLAHHSSAGCNMRAGDMLASGTISGEVKESYGSLQELCWGGKEPIKLKNGDQRTFIQDFDTVTFRGFCSTADNNLNIGFGECSGQILPAEK